MRPRAFGVEDMEGRCSVRIGGVVIFTGDAVEGARIVREWNDNGMVRFFQPVVVDLPDDCALYPSPE